MDGPTTRRGPLVLLPRKGAAPSAQPPLGVRATCSAAYLQRP